MPDRPYVLGSATRIFFGFVAGFFSTLIFHQLMLTLLWAVGFASIRPFPMAATQPFGVPGIVFAGLSRAFPQGRGYWITAFLFGAVLPSLVALLVVLPMKGRPMGGGWHPALLLTAFLINGAWGVGTGIFLSAFQAWSGISRGRLEVKNP